MPKERTAIHSTKDILSHLPPEIPIKILQNFTKAPGYKNTRGRTRGTWMQRISKTISQHSAWLFKGGGGQGALPKLAAGELHAIREAYAGEIYQLFFPEHTAKTRLVVNVEFEKNNSWKYYVGSKEIKQLTFLPPEKINHKGFIRSHKVEVTKVFILSMLLGEIDFSFSNCAISTNNKFIKIDHGESFAFQQDGKEFIKKLNIKEIFSPVYWSKASMGYLSNDYFTKEVIEEALSEIMNVNLDKVIFIADKYEKLISEYRNQFKEKSFYLIGNAENKIKDIFLGRFNLISEFYSSQRKNLDVVMTTPRLR